MGGRIHKSFEVRFASLKGTGLGAFTARFARDDRGVSAVIFSILFAALFLFIAVSVDYSRALTEQSEQQYALDAAVLAASQHMGAADQDTSGQTTAAKFFKENMPSGSTAQVTVSLNSDSGTICGNSVGSIATTFLNTRAAGEMQLDKIDVGANTCAVKGNGTIEVALVVDNSGSMSGTKIADLKTAAHELVDIVFAGTDGGDKVKVGVIPFAGSVNVGSVYANADWIDTGALSSTHLENFDATPTTRFSLFAALGQTWGGCVEARPSTVETPYDTDDTTPTNTLADTKFVPMFAPDEPDDTNADAAGYDNYPNNYISDYGGTCPAAAQICVRTNRRTGLCTQYQNATIPVAEAQSRVCKYAGAAISGGGPNYGCTTPAILPLTSTEATVEAAVDGLVASGYTNIGEGTMWGMRVLSPNAPFTDGRSYTDTENRKILVVMTDGDNTYSHQDNNPNQSVYGAFGYGSKDRLGTTYSSTAYGASMDTKLTNACTTARAAGISVYTVAFGTGVSTDTLTLLQSCAGDADRAFVAVSGSSLIQAFQNIGKDIALLRVSQ